MTDAERGVVFLSCIITMEIAALLHKDAPNRGVRNCCNELMRKHDDYKIRHILNTIRSAPLPNAAVQTFRREAERIAEGRLTLEDR